MFDDAEFLHVVTLVHRTRLELEAREGREYVRTCGLRCLTTGRRTGGDLQLEGEAYIESFKLTFIFAMSISMTYICI